MFQKSCSRALRGRLCIAVIAALVAAAPASLRAEALTPQQQLAFDIYKELVEIDTTTATGDTKQAAEAMAARLRAAGFAEADVQVFSPAPRKGNLVARLRGSGARKPILLLAHLDVVPARREDWSFDPFKLIEQDGYYYARGSGDDKFMAAAFVTNMIRYKQEGYKPDRDIILGAGDRRGDSGRQCARHSVAAEKPPRPDRRRIRAERGRRRRPKGRQGDPQQRSDHRKSLARLSAQREKWWRAQLGSGQGQRHLSSGGRLGAAVEIQLSAKVQ
jgi:Peptidase family M20/M25/M40